MNCSPPGSSVLHHRSGSTPPASQQACDPGRGRTTPLILVLGLFKQPLPALWGICGDSALAPEKLEALWLSQDVALSPRAAGRRESCSLGPPEAPPLLSDQPVGSPTSSRHQGAHWPSYAPIFTKVPTERQLHPPRGVEGTSIACLAPRGESSPGWRRQRGFPPPSLSSPSLKAASLSIENPAPSLLHGNAGTARGPGSLVPIQWPHEAREPHVVRNWPISTRFQAT